MKVSIITPTFNSAHTVRYTIESVIQQTYLDIEYIIVDGGSQDETSTIVAQYSESIDVFISEPDQGVYDAMNKGIRIASGDIVAILNSDDYYSYPNVIQKIVETFRLTMADSVYGDLQYIDSADSNRVIRYWKSGTFARRNFLFGWMPPHPAFFVRRTVYQSYGSFHLNLNQSADYELMLRFLYRHQISTSYLADILVHMQVGGISNANWRSRLNAYREDCAAWKINDLQPYTYTILLKKLSKVWQFFHRDKPKSTTINSSTLWFDQTGQSIQPDHN